MAMTLPVGAFHSDDATHLAAGRHLGAGWELSWGGANRERGGGGGFRGMMTAAPAQAYNVGLNG